MVFFLGALYPSKKYKYKRDFLLAFIVFLPLSLVPLYIPSIFQKITTLHSSINLLLSLLIHQDTQTAWPSACPDPILLNREIYDLVLCFTALLLGGILWARVLHAPERISVTWSFPIQRGPDATLRTEPNQRAETCSESFTVTTGTIYWKERWKERNCKTWCLVSQKFSFSTSYFPFGGPCHLAIFLWKLILPCLPRIPGA